MKTTIIALSLIACASGIAGATEKLGFVKENVQTYKGEDKFKTEYRFRGHAIRVDGTEVNHFKSEYAYKTPEHAEAALKQKIGWLKAADKENNYSRFRDPNIQVKEIVGWLEKHENLPNGVKVIPRDE